MSKNLNIEFGNYLRGLREYRELSTQDVEERILKQHPQDKMRQISTSYLNAIERGDRPPPHPLKIKSLSEVYGENHELMLYRAGYLERNPATEPDKWNKQDIRDLYLEQFPLVQKTRSLTESEKRHVDKFVENLIETFLSKS